MGMLTTVAYILAMDTFGPITDNAGGIAEMSGAPEQTRLITDELDAVGNTTKALTKGYAVASAALAAFLLFSAYLDEVSRVLASRGLPPFAVVDLAKLTVFIGAFLGAMLMFLFSSLAIRAVGKAAGDIIEEVRRQFKADPGIMAGTSPTRLSPVRGHHYEGGVTRDGPSWCLSSWCTSRDRTGSRSRSGSGNVDGGHHRWNPAGNGAQQ